MAILSNINGKFAVESSGAIQLSGSAGTSGYVLKSNGTGSAASWVDPTTIIGGPYLPLSGGTLTGATATANNISFTVGGQFNINGVGNWSFRSTSVSGNLILKDESNNADRVDFHPDGQVEILAAGSRFYPSIIFNNDINTGIYHAAADTLGFSGGGNELMTLNYSNGIKLSQYGSGSYTGTTAYTLAVDSSGNIIETTDGGGDITGSGTTNTVAKFTGAKAIGNGPVTFSGNNSTFAGTVTGGNGTFTNLTISATEKLRFDGAGGHTYIEEDSNDTLIFATGGTTRLTLDANARFHGMVGIGMTPGTAGGSTYMLQMYNSGSQCFLAIGNGTSGNGPLNGLVIGNDTGNAWIVNRETTPMILATSDTERMRISHDGKVGIGTTSPSYKLHVSGTGGTRFSVTNTDTNWAAIQIQASGNQADYIFFKDDTEERARIAALDTSDLIFYNTDSVTERMRITSAGIVGIGTSSPNSGVKLEVNGIISANGDQSPTGGGLGFGDYQSGGYKWIQSFESQELRINPLGNNVTFPASNVGIGTNNPTARLKVIGANDAWTCQIENTQALPYGLSVNTTGTAGTTFNSAFYTHSGTGMYIVNNGRVGIGTTSPAVALDVRGEIAVAYNATYGLRFYNDARNNWSSIGNTITGSSSANLVFKDATGEVMRIATGKVGIGTTSPSQLFHCNGNALISKLGVNAFNAGFDFYNNGTTYLNGATTLDANLTISQTNAEVNFTSGNGTIRTTGAGSVIFGTNSTERMRILSSGYIGMNEIPSGFATLEIKNISSTTYSLYADYTDTNGSYGVMKVILTGASTSPSYVDWWYGATQTGAVVTTGSSTQYLTSSDYRLKENIVPMSNAIDRVKQLKPSRFNFIGHENTVDGLIAHEVAEVVPEAVNGEKDGLRDDGTPKYQGIDEGKLVPLLIGAIQELEARVKELENK